MKHPGKRPGTRPGTVAPRVAVTRLLQGVAAGQSLQQLLAPALATVKSEDRGFVQALTYASLRRSTSTPWLLGRLLSQPLARGGERLRALLQAALTELRDFATPAYAAVNAAVEAVRELGVPGAAGLVNAVLRRFLRERATLEAALEADIAASSEHPVWLREALKAAFPEHWPILLRANLSQAPMWLRINPTFGDATRFVGLLDQAGTTVPGLAQTLGLPIAVDPVSLPQFAQGSCSVQDLSAQHCGWLLAPQKGERILDACAAPGGKTTQLLEMGAGEVLALDVEAARLKRLHENLARLGRHADVRCADAAQPALWWDGHLFDAILLDAPCSATGIIRRHPDILSLRRETDLAPLAATQARLLTALWPLLKPGGRLLYASCSVLPGEGETLLGDFLKAHPDARERLWTSPVPGAFSHARSCGRLNLPGEVGADGFYLCLLDKRP